jgi:hypothetical protein
MTNRGSDLSKSMDANTTSSSTSDQSIQLELDRYIVANLRSSLGILPLLGLSSSLSIGRKIPHRNLIYGS